MTLLCTRIGCFDRVVVLFNRGCFLETGGTFNRGVVLFRKRGYLFNRGVVLFRKRGTFYTEVLHVMTLPPSKAPSKCACFGGDHLP